MAKTAVSGIYEIVNLENGKRYIGSAVSLSKRWAQHKCRLRATKHYNAKLQNSWTKYGADKFLFRIVLICAPADLVFFEQLFLDAFQPQLNISPTAGSTLGVALSDERKQKIAAKAKGRKRDPKSVERAAAKLRGVKLSPEHVQTLLGNKNALGHKHTEGWKAANSLRHIGRLRPKSPEYRAKISATLKGVTHSAERRAKQAAAQLGTKRGPYKLDPAKAEQRRLRGLWLGARQRGTKRSPETIEKMRIAATGKVMSDAAKKKISDHVVEMWAKRREEIIAARRGKKTEAQNEPCLFDYRD